MSRGLLRWPRRRNSRRKILGLSWSRSGVAPVHEAQLCNGWWACAALLAGTGGACGTSLLQ